MDTRILLVSVDQDSASQAGEAFSGNGYRVTSVPGVERALARFGLVLPNLVVLDLPPDDAGRWLVLERFRGLGAAPILVVNGPEGQRARAEDLYRGADDVVTSEVGSIELQARARALARRRQGMF